MLFDLFFIMYKYLFWILLLVHRKVGKIYRNSQEKTLPLLFQGLQTFMCLNATFKLFINEAAVDKVLGCLHQNLLR